MFFTECVWQNVFHRMCFTELCFTKCVSQKVFHRTIGQKYYLWHHHCWKEVLGAAGRQFPKLDNRSQSGSLLVNKKSTNQQNLLKKLTCKQIKYPQMWQNSQNIVAIAKCVKYDIFIWLRVSSKKYISLRWKIFLFRLKQFPVAHVKGISTWHRVDYFCSGRLPSGRVGCVTIGAGRAGYQGSTNRRIE